MIFVIEPPTDYTAFELAEWIETHLLLSRSTAVSKTQILSAFPAGQGPDGAEVEQLFSEILRRASYANSVYPFTVSDEQIIIDADIDPSAYKLLLLLSIEKAPFRASKELNEINPVFELLTREALVSLGGAGTIAKRFGWPSSDGRPEFLGDAIHWLTDEMGLRRGAFDGEVDRNDKDGGIDVVAWQPFDDDAPSFPVWMAQCTVQVTYERKPADVEPDKWMTWIRLGKGPQITLSVPYAIPYDSKVRDQLKYKAHIVLDRFRLCRLLRGVILESYPEYTTMKQWTDKHVDATAAAMSLPTRRRPALVKRRRPVQAVRAKVE